MKEKNQKKSKQKIDHRAKLLQSNGIQGKSFVSHRETR